MDRPDIGVGEIWQIADAALGLFGPDRIMFGTNFPIDARRIDPHVHLARHLAALATLSADERDAILVRTARRVYRIE